jgi:hypothetical protein
VEHYMTQLSTAPIWVHSSIFPICIEVWRQYYWLPIFFCDTLNMEMIFRYVWSLCDLSGERMSGLIRSIEGNQNDVIKWREIICDSGQSRSAVRKEISVRQHSNRLMLWFIGHWSSKYLWWYSDISYATRRKIS